MLLWVGIGKTWCISTGLNIATGIIAERSLHCCQYRRVFIIAPLPTENNNILGLKFSLCHCIQTTNLFMAQLPTAVCSE
jgi:hypothetical protein